MRQITNNHPRYPPTEMTFRARAYVSTDFLPGKLRRRSLNARLPCSNNVMPKVRRSRKPPPDGWELIEPTLDELDQKMREGVKINILY